MNNDNASTEQTKEPLSAPSAFNAGLGVWTATYTSGGRSSRNGYLRYDYVIVANTKGEALGLALNACLDTDADGWAFEKLDIEIVGATFISAESS